jgi:hypothetical protein
VERHGGTGCGVLFAVYGCSQPLLLLYLGPACVVTAAAAAAASITAHLGDGWTTCALYYSLHMR